MTNSDKYSTRRVREAISLFLRRLISTSVLIVSTGAMSGCCHFCVRPPAPNPQFIYHWVGEDLVIQSEYTLVSDDDETIVIVGDDVSLGTLEQAMVEQREILTILRELDIDTDLEEEGLSVVALPVGEADEGYCSGQQIPDTLLKRFS